MSTATAANLLPFKRKTDETGSGSWETQDAFRDQTQYDTTPSTTRSAYFPDAPAVPARSIQILDLGSKKLALKVPLPVSIEVSEDQVVARSYDLDLFECGDTEGEALDSLREMIVEFFFALKGDGANRSAYLTRKFEFLESITKCP